MVLSICCGAGLLDKAFQQAGFPILPGCEIDPDQRAVYRAFCSQTVLTHDLAGLINQVAGQRFDGIIGGPPCQSHSSLRYQNPPKHPDLTGLVTKLLEAVEWEWFLFENVLPIELPGAKCIRLDARHFSKPHQSRPRWFTYSANLVPPQPIYSGTIDELMAYPAVYGRLYGPKRGGILQGFREITELGFPSPVLQKALANGVPRGLGAAWATAIRTCTDVSACDAQVLPRQ